MAKQYRGYNFLTRVQSLDDFQRQFKLSNGSMKDAGAREDYDTNVIKKILKKMSKRKYLVRYIDTGDQNTDYWLIYTK